MSKNKRRVLHHVVELPLTSVPDRAGTGVIVDLTRPGTYTVPAFREVDGTFFVNLPIRKEGDTFVLDLPRQGER